MARNVPADAEDADRHEGHRARRAHVGLEHHERPEEAEHQPDGPQHRPPVADASGPAGEEVGAVEQQGELGQLRRLDAHRTDAEPPGRPVDVDPDAGHEHEHQQPGRDDQRRADVAAQRPVVDAGGDGQGDEAEDHPGELTLEEQPRRPVVGQRLDRRRREHHDEADEVEDDDRRQQRVVAGRAEAAAVAPGLPGPADRTPDLRLPGLAPLFPGRRGCGPGLDDPAACAGGGANVGRPVDLRSPRCRAGPAAARPRTMGPGDRRAVLVRRHESASPGSGVSPG